MKTIAVNSYRVHLCNLYFIVLYWIGRSSLMHRSTNREKYRLKRMQMQIFINIFSLIQQPMYYSGFNFNQKQERLFQNFLLRFTMNCTELRPHKSKHWLT